AITDLERSLNIAPSEPAAEALVLMQLAAGEWQHATDAADKLRLAQPDNPVPENLLGSVKLAQFDLEGARAQFSAIVEKHPDFLPARLNLARALQLEGKPDQAEKVLSDFLVKEPANVTALRRLVELLLREGKAEAALSAAERAHNAAPTNQGITI